MFLFGPGGDGVVVPGGLGEIRLRGHADAARLWFYIVGLAFWFFTRSTEDAPCDMAAGVRPKILTRLLRTYLYRCLTE